MNVVLTAMKRIDYCAYKTCVKQDDIRIVVTIASCGSLPDF